MKSMRTVAVAAALAAVLAVNGQSFSKGDLMVDLSIGAGAARTTQESGEAYKLEDATKGMFTQRLSVEYGVASLSPATTLAVGVAFQNGLASTTTVASGSYNYTYTQHAYRRNSRMWEMYDTRTIERAGSGRAVAKDCIDDFSAAVQVVLHHEFVSNLDTYFGLRFGVARVSHRFHDFEKEDGFSKKYEPFDPNYDGRYQLAFAFDDLDHTEWANGGAEGRFLVGLYIGARYFMSDHWGVNVELGLPAVTLCKDYNNVQVFSIGATYKF